MMFLLVFNLILIVGLVAHIKRLYAIIDSQKADIEARDRLVDHLYRQLERS